MLYEVITPLLARQLDDPHDGFAGDAVLRVGAVDRLPEFVAAVDDAAEDGLRSYNFV